MPARRNALRNLIVPGQEKIGFPSARRGGRERVSRLFFAGHPSGGYDDVQLFLYPEQVHQVLRHPVRPSLQGRQLLRPVQHPGGHPRSKPHRGEVHGLRELYALRFLKRGLCPLFPRKGGRCIRKAAKPLTAAQQISPRLRTAKAVAAAAAASSDVLHRRMSCSARFEFNSPSGRISKGLRPLGIPTGPKGPVLIHFSLFTLTFSLARQ